MRKRIRQKESKGLNKKDMLTVTGRIKKGKIVLDEQIGVHDGKVLVTFIEEKEIQPLEPVKNFGKELRERASEAKIGWYLVRPRNNGRVSVFKRIKKKII